MSLEATGAILSIPDTVLKDVAKAEEKLAKLEAKSKTTAEAVAKHWNTIASGGMDTFIQKIQKASDTLAAMKMPTIDGSKLAESVVAIATSMASLDKSSTTGANRIGRIADNLSKLAALPPMGAVFREIADGITMIGNTSQATIANVSTLATAMATLAKDIRTVAAARDAEANKTAKAAEYNKLYKEQVSLVQRLHEIQRKGGSITADEKREWIAISNRLMEIDAQIDKLNRKKQTAASDLARITGESRLSNATTRSTADGAMAYAKQAKSLKELQDAYKNLKAVMATVDPESKKWQQLNAVFQQTKERIENIKRQMGDLNTHTRRAHDMAAQLGNRLAAMFSIAAISGYINKLVEVRAQFELQQTALRAILKDKDEADRIFMQVQQMALQSPFSIMQINTFVKQLAAYRIESEKLVGTTKMLADVSAGLGVDIARLVLAYGQVKSANYLRACLGRGTQVKMFDGTFKNVENVIIGDALMGDDERPRYVSKLYQGEQQMYRVSYDGGMFRCNEHHILTVYDALNERIEDVLVFDYLKEPHRYQGVRRIKGEYKTFLMKVEADNIDRYYGFSIDGNRRFIIEDNVVTHNTEVRQFTEAGLNIAGELAQYFSELQGKMISVGDVMEMITKRMVRFEDVEEVFKRVTSAGGLFYDMQKKQADTLWGQLQRIQDAMSIMMNEIGQSNQSTISSVLTVIRELMTNWRTFATELEAALYLLGSYKVAMMFAKLATSQFGASLMAAQGKFGSFLFSLADFSKKATIAGKSMQLLRNSLVGLSAAAIPLALITGLTLLVHALITAHENAVKLRNELNNIAIENSADMQKSIDNYQRLARTVADVTTSYEERNAALEELQRTYGEILPKQDLEREGIEAMAGNYDRATEAIRTYYNAKKQEAQIGAAEKSISDNIMKLVNKNMADINKLVPSATADIVAKLYEESIIQGIKDGNTSGGYIMKVWAKKMGEYYIGPGISLSLQSVYDNLSDMFDTNWVGVDFKDVIRDQRTLNSLRERGVALFDTESEAERNELIGLQRRLSVWEERLNAVTKAYQELYRIKSKGNLYTDDGGLTRVGADALNSLNAARQALGMAAVQQSELNNLLLNQETVLTNIGTITRNVYYSAQKEIKSTTDVANKFKETLGFKKQGAEGTALQKEWRDAINVLIETQGVSADVFDKIKVDSTTTRTQLVKDLKAWVDEMENSIKEFDKIFNNALWTDPEQAEQVAGMTKEQRDEMEKTLPFIKQLAEAFGALFKSMAGGGRTRDIWGERLTLMQKVNKEYEKLLKYYTKEQAMLKIRQSFADAAAEVFAGTQWADINNWGGFDAKATISQLRGVAEQASKEARKKILEQIGVLESELEINVKKEEIERAKREVEGMFDNFELGKTLKSLNLPIELTAMVGGEPVEIEELSKYINDKLKAAKAAGGQEELVKYYEEQLRKVNDIELKSQQERLKNYANYLKHVYGEQADYMIKSYMTMMDMRKDFENSIAKTKNQLPGADSATAAVLRGQIEMYERQLGAGIEGIKKEMEKRMNAFDWEQFKGSPIFTQMYQDVETLSQQGIAQLIQQLEVMRGKLQSAANVDPKAIREITQYIEKLKDAQAKFNPLGSLAQSLKEVNKLRRQGITLEQAESNLINATNRVNQTEREIVDLNTIIGLKEKGYSVDQIAAVVGDEQHKTASMNIAALKIILALKNNQLQKDKDEQDAAQDNVNTYQNAIKTIKSSQSELAEIAALAKDVMGPLIDGLELVGGELDDTDKALLDTFTNAIMKSLDLILQMEMLKIAAKAMGVQMNAALGVIGWIALALSVVVDLFTALFAAKDKRLQKQIDALQNKVDGLTRKFEKLKEAIDNAFTSSQLKVTSRDAIRTLDEQKRAYEEMIALEEAKKKTDEDKIKDYKDKIADLGDQIIDTRNAITQAWGGFGGMDAEASAAEDIAKAWLDSFRETGDGLDALNEKWDEYINNLLVKQMYLRIVSARMKRLFDMVDYAVSAQSAEGEHLTQQELNDINKERVRIMEGLNSELKYMAGMFGITGGGDTILSDLQKGIQNITEPQAAAIEAYLNSIRFEIFKHTEQLTAIVNAIQAQYSSANSPMLEQVRAIRDMVTDIRNDLRKVIVPKNQSSNFVLKVN